MKKIFLILVAGLALTLSNAAAANPLANTINFTDFGSGTTDGMAWYDATQKVLELRTVGQTEIPVRCLFTQTADATVGNTNATASTVGTGIGSMTIAANYLVPGRYIRVIQEGIIANVAGPPSIRWRLKIGSAFVCDTAVTTMTAITGTTRYHVEFLCRVTGAVGATAACYCTGEFRYYTAAALMVGNQGLDQGATIATNGSLLFDVQETWGTQAAGNTLTSKTTTMEILNWIPILFIPCGLGRRVRRKESHELIALLN